MSIFRNAFYPWGIKKKRVPVDETLSIIRKSPESDTIIRPGVSGKVKWFDSHRGYGFIEVSVDLEAFVHFSDIDGEGYRVLEPGDKVTLDLAKTARGYQALHVKRQMS